MSSLNKVLDGLRHFGLYPLSPASPYYKIQRILGLAFFYYGVFRTTLMTIDLIQLILADTTEFDLIIENVPLTSQAAVVLYKMASVLFENESRDWLISRAQRMETNMLRSIGVKDPDTLDRAEILRTQPRANTPNVDQYGRDDTDVNDLRMDMIRKRLILGEYVGYYTRIDKHYKFFLWVLMVISTSYPTAPLTEYYFVLRHQNVTEDGIKPRPQFAFREYNPLDLTNPVWYGLSMSTQLLISCLIPLCLGAHIAFLSALMIVGVGHLRILQVEFRFRREKDTNGQLAGRLGSGGRKTLKQLIKDHCEVVEYVKELNKWSRRFFLADFIIYFFAIVCLYNYVVTVDHYLQLQVAAVTFNLILIFSYTSVFYWHASQTTIEAQKLSDFLFKTDWTQLPVSQRKSMQIMMAFAQKPIFYTLGGFAALSPAVYLMILRTTFSSLTLLNELQNGEED